MRMNEYEGLAELTKALSPQKVPMRTLVVWIPSAMTTADGSGRFSESNNLGFGRPSTPKTAEGEVRGTGFSKNAGD